MGVKAEITVEDSPITTSGQSKGRRLRFANALTGPYVSLSTLTSGKDLYLLEFGANANAVGSILLVCSLIAPLMDSTMGALQDQGRFVSKFFPVGTWGKRAPWMLTHTLLLAPVMTAFYLPPSYDKVVVHIWFSVIWLASYWCVAAAVNSFESARVAVFPSREERVNVEQYCKLTVAVGSGVGSGMTFMALTYPSLLVFLTAGTLSFVVVLTGLSSIDVLKQAKVSKNEEEEDVTTTSAQFRVLLELISNPMVRRMALIRCVCGLYEMIMPSLLIYHYTYVFEMDKTTRAFWYAVSGFLMGVFEMAPAPFWSWLFANSSSKLLYVPISLHLVHILACPLAMFFIQDVHMFLGYIVLRQLCSTPYSYWRVVATAWMCDHDARDREGQILGLMTTATNLGRALSSAFVVLGMGWAGLKTFNCLEDDGPVADQCELEKITSQPESLKTYLKVMMGIGQPLFEILFCLLTAEFPIKPKSRLLDEILEKQSSRKLNLGKLADLNPEILDLDLQKATFKLNEPVGNSNSNTNGNMAGFNANLLTVIGNAEAEQPGINDMRAPEMPPECPICPPPQSDLDVRPASARRSPPPGERPGGLPEAKSFAAATAPAPNFPDRIPEGRDQNVRTGRPTTESPLPRRLEPLAGDREDAARGRGAGAAAPGAGGSSSSSSPLQLFGTCFPGGCGPTTAALGLAVGSPCAPSLTPTSDRSQRHQERRGTSGSRTASAPPTTSHRSRRDHADSDGGEGDEDERRGAMMPAARATRSEQLGKDSGREPHLPMPLPMSQQFGTDMKNRAALVQGADQLLESGELAVAAQETLE